MASNATRSDALTAFPGQRRAAVSALQLARAAVEEADQELRRCEEARRGAERLRDHRRKALGRAIAALRHELEIPATRAARAITNGSVVEYAELEDGQRWHEHEVRRALEFFLQEAKQGAGGGHG